jgi:hypothetical protein
MKRISIVLAAGVMALACRSGAGTGPAASTKPQWSYSGPTGPVISGYNRPTQLLNGRVISTCK